MSIYSKYINTYVAFSAEPQLFGDKSDYSQSQNIYILIVSLAGKTETLLNPALAAIF